MKTVLKIILVNLSYTLFISNCGLNDNTNINYRGEMRNFVINVSQTAKKIKPEFLVIPQNGIELITENGQSNGKLSTEYLTAIDGSGQEDLFYGYENDDQATDKTDTDYLIELLNVSKNFGNIILTTDYCSTQANVDNSYLENNIRGYISFAANQRDLNSIPAYPAPIYNSNADNINALNKVKNFLYLINTDNFISKADFINAIIATDYDLLIIDLFFNDGTIFSQDEINQLKTKANNGTRLVICYMSIGEAEDYRYYWQPDWSTNPPQWLDNENPDWPGNFKVKYWDPAWQKIIYDKDSSYLRKIINTNFDGVYLDIIDAFNYFE